jgi:hypothetical protein
MDSNKVFNVTTEWFEWVRENVALGVKKETLMSVLEGKGFPPNIVSALLEIFGIAPSGKTDPCSELRFRKIKWLLNSLRELGDLSEGAGKIAERSQLDQTEFFSNFYARNTPVVYRQCLSPSSLKESLEWNVLRKKAGHAEVEIQKGRSSTDDFEIKSNSLKSNANFGDFLDRVTTGEESNDFYMTANNASSNANFLNHVLDTSTVCPEFLNGAQSQNSIFLWIGPKGTFTPGHHDLTNNLFLQVKGSKSFRLASSLALLEVGNDQHCYTKTKLEEVDQKRQQAGLPPVSFTVTVNEGDVLFIPLGWWHEVTGIEPSISVSATNFKLRNDFFSSYSFYGSLE